MTAGKYGYVVIPIVPLRALNYLPREMNRKRCVVASIDEFRAFFLPREEIPVTGRADGEPEFA
jgi:hypothetical protein